MLLSELHFDLPSHLIAQEPLQDRSASRMLVVDRAANTFTDRMFVDLPELLHRGDLLVTNNTQVFPARLHGVSDTGAKIELFLVRPVESDVWEALAKPARRLAAGKLIDFGPRLHATVEKRMANGRVHVRLTSDEDLESVIDEIGRTPLPPYIKRDRESSDLDRDRYQTIFAKQRGAIAAPTAGLHFTSTTVDALRRSGVELAEITLHVGYGTFEPIRENDLSQHRVAAENYHLSQEAAEKLTAAKQSGRRIVAVGTTTTRVLETTCRPGLFEAGVGCTDLTITPGYSFNAVDALITNFHLPESSLLLLTTVFGGRELVMRAYRHAVRERYRFYSYGDCMLLI